jgi:L-asparagine transporter-like permease
MAMVAVGGSIGTGLLLGSAAALEIAGPGVILSFALAAFITLTVALALGELSSLHPGAGSFGVYGDIYLNQWAGFIARAGYWAALAISIGAEMVASATYLAFWFPSVPALVWVTVLSVFLLLINLRSVENYARFEYWFAMIKVAAICAFIIVGLALIFGVGGRPAIGLANLTQHGGFLPAGWKGVWLSLTITVTSYMGVEIIAVTAGEAQNPAVTIIVIART